MKHDRIQSLDSYYQSRPDTRPKLLYPVFGREGTVGWFEDYYAAVDFVNANLGKRNLYIGKSVDPLLPENRKVA